METGSIGPHGIIIGGGQSSGHERGSCVWWMEVSCALSHFGGKTPLREGGWKCVEIIARWNAAKRTGALWLKEDAKN